MDSPTEVGTFSLHSFTVRRRQGPAQTLRIALHHDGSRGRRRRLRPRRREDRPRDDPDLRRAAALRRRHLHLPLRLPAVGQRRRHGAPQQHGAVVAGRAAQPRRSGRASSAPSRTSSSTPGTWSGSAREAIEPFDFEDANVSGELWFGEGVTSYYDDLIVHRAGLQSLEDLLASYAGLINAVTLSPGRAAPLRRGDEPAGAVCRRRGVDRPHGLGQHLHLLLHLGRGARPGASTCRCARRPPARPASTTTCS